MTIIGSKNIMGTKKNRIYHSNDAKIMFAIHGNLNDVVHRVSNISLYVSDKSTYDVWIGNNGFPQGRPIQGIRKFTGNIGKALIKNDPFIKEMLIQLFGINSHFISENTLKTGSYIYNNMAVQGDKISIIIKMNNSSTYLKLDGIVFNNYGIQINKNSFILNNVSFECRSIVYYNP